MACRLDPRGLAEAAVAVARAINDETSLIMCGLYRHDAALRAGDVIDAWWRELSSRMACMRDESAGAAPRLFADHHVG
jgi:hypothetical protein